MTEGTYKKAVELKKDIYNMDKQIKEITEDRHWVVVVTPRTADLAYSHRFQKELLEWLKNKREEYQKEFEQLV